MNNRTVASASFPFTPIFLRNMALIAVLFVSAFLESAHAAERPKKNFDVPAGEAVSTLKMFVEQSGDQVIYVVSNVRGIKTNPVLGTYTSREALDAMMSNTPLVVLEDAQTVALSVSRKSA